MRWGAFFFFFFLSDHTSLLKFPLQTSSLGWCFTWWSWSVCFRRLVFKDDLKSQLRPLIILCSVVFYLAVLKSELLLFAVAVRVERPWLFTNDHFHCNDSSTSCREPTLLSNCRICPFQWLGWPTVCSLFQAHFKKGLFLNCFWNHKRLLLLFYIFQSLLTFPVHRGFYTVPPHTTFDWAAMLVFLPGWILLWSGLGQRVCSLISMAELDLCAAHSSRERSHHGL